MPDDYTKCSAIIYDAEGNHLDSVIIWAHDAEENYVETRDTLSLDVGSLCEMLILTDPAPQAYKGRVHRHGARKIIRLFQGKSVENRRETRYKTDIPADITGVVYDGRVYPLHTPMSIRLLNISVGGMRINAAYNALTDGARFQVHIKIGDGDKVLTADVVYREDTPSGGSEFGCRLVDGGSEA